MQLVANQQLVRNRVRLGLGFLFASFIVLLIAVTVAWQIELMESIWYVVYGALGVGIILVTVAQSQLRRFGPRNRADEQLAKAIRGLDERYKLYAFISSSLPDYILVSPGGVHALVVQPDTGEITCRRDVWSTRRSPFSRLFGSGFGNPTAEAAKQLQRLRKLLTESGLDDIPSGAVIVFTNDGARLRVEGCTSTVTKLGSLEDVMRRLAGKGQNVVLNQARVRAVQKVFDERMSAAKAWR